MASITGKDGYVTKQVTGVDTLVAGIKEWSIDYTSDLIDVTAFSITGATHKDVLSVLKSGTGTFIGNMTDGDTGCDEGTAYNIMLAAHSGRAYYGSAHIQSKGISVTIDGEALMTYGFQFTGKVYVLDAEVVVDGSFTGNGSDWDVSDVDVSYDASNDQIDWSGNADVVPASNDVITNGTSYWTQMLLENETGATACALKLGASAGTSRTANGTYTEVITADNTTFTISVTTDGTLSLSKIQIRPILN